MLLHWLCLNDHVPPTGLLEPLSLWKVYPLLCGSHGKERPTEFAEQAAHTKEPGTLTIRIGRHLGDALTETVDQGRLGIALFLWVSIHKVVLPARAIAAPGIAMVQMGQCRHVGTKLTCL